MDNVQDDYTTTRNVGRTTPIAHDEKDALDYFKATVQRRKKFICIGLAFLVVVIVGISIGVSTKTESIVNKEAMQDTLTPSFSDIDEASQTSQTQVDEGYNADQFVKENLTIAVGSAEDISLNTTEQDSSLNTTEPEQVIGEASTNLTDALLPPTPSESTLQISSENALTYSIVDFDWTDASKWEYASGATVPANMITSNGITLTSDNSAEPIRTKEGWSGEKVVYVAWERSSTSDTNIWMLNTKLEGQFEKGNGWPYWGELDLFEVFTQDAVSMPTYDFSGFGSFTDVSSYGQMTMHMGPATEDGSPCFCPASPTKSLWYGDTPSMTSGCTAQFSNDASNSIAAVWGSDSTGKYIQLFQNPVITKGGKLNGVDTYDVAAGSGSATSKIYNNANLFWGVDATAPCATAGGHDAATGFPFFESFRLLFEEQKKGDSSASFTVKSIQIFTKN